MALKSLRGHLNRITFHNPDNGFTIAQIEPEAEEKQSVGEVTVVGVMIGVAEGQTVEVAGDWVDHPRYGKQLQVDEYRAIYPTTEDGIRRFLASGLIKGVGPVSATRIVAHFGMETLRVIDDDPKRLLEVPGLGRKRAGLLARSWAEQRQLKDTMVFLQSHGVGAAAAVKIFKQYEEGAIETVRSNPYQLERDIAGIGFLTADRIAAQLGMDRDAPQRLQAGLRYLLEKAAEEGHVYVPEEELRQGGTDLLSVAAELISAALNALAGDGGVVAENHRFYLPHLHAAEVNIAASMRRLLKAPAAAIDESGETPEEEEDLSAGQNAALKLAMTSKVLVLTGGPGTGKTTVTRAILRQFESGGLRVLLCSPTGRAAKRLQETSGREARTIHRLLEFLPAEGRFRRDHRDPVEADAIIVDEASMIDVLLMNSLLKALLTETRLIIVGDADQLPSVGPGNILGDIIAAQNVPTVRLTEIHRQVRGSRIVVNAHNINRGEWPELDNSSDGDFFFIEEEDSAAVAELIVDLCQRRLPPHGGYDAIGDIQVLTPMYRGDTGAINLNNQLQQRLNPGGKAYRHGEREFRVGDKVLQVRNNYDRGVFNGDLGRIRAGDPEEGTLTVVFDSGVLCEYSPEALDELVLAFAISVHRAQGSEFPVVVLPLTTQHYPMLQRNLLYTAITRARQLLVVVGSRRAFARAIANNQVAERHTTLGQRLSADQAVGDPATASAS